MKPIGRVALGRSLRFLAGLVVLSPGVVRATEQLPVIVTYELQRQHVAAHALQRDPKAFWIAQILARIEDKREPSRLKLPAPRTVEVRFTVGRDGRLAGSDVAGSSGMSELDKVALAMVQRAQPFPPAPASLRDPALTFALPVRFK